MCVVELHIIVQQQNQAKSRRRGHFDVPDLQGPTHPARCVWPSGIWPERLRSGRPTPRLGRAGGAGLICLALPTRQAAPSKPSLGCRLTQL